MELLKKLKCRLHGKDSWCWKSMELPFSGKTCIRLGVDPLWKWASAIAKGLATKFIPPDIELFHNLKRGHYKVKGRKGQQNSDDGASPMNFAVYLDTQHVAQWSIRYPSPQTPQCNRSHSLDLKPSPVRGFSAGEYNTEGLMAYLNWVAENQRDTEYTDLYDTLYRSKIGIDLFKRACGNEKAADRLYHQLTIDCLVKLGMATRLLELFQDWQVSLANIN